MSNTNHLVARQMDRNRRHMQARLEKQRLACRCGGTKDSERMMVCLACFQSAPLALQRDAYSRVPEVRRTAMRQLLSRAESRKAERLLAPQRHEGHRDNSGGPVAAVCDRRPETRRSQSAATAGHHFPGGELTTDAVLQLPRIQAEAVNPAPAPAGASSHRQSAIANRQ